MMNRSRKIVGRLATCFVVSGAALGGLSGCQNPDQALLETNRAQQERINALVQDVESRDNTIAALRGELDALRAAGSARGGLVSELERENAQLRQQLMALDEQLRGMGFGSLDAETDLALAQFAAEYPDLIEYDSRRGMLRLRSDLTFGSGSTEIQPEAESTLTQLADIFNSPSAERWDIRVVGHTDSQPVTARPGRRFRNNEELSMFRAIAVRDVLARAGVANERIEFAGRGPWEPRVPNTGNGNTPQNRRVEIFLFRPFVEPEQQFAPVDPDRIRDDMMK